ncbi:alpha/beta fold hydrolase [Polyangium spumosum]|uniref:Alpha/beta fold hydrolase n=1 Tax=Polyangium spumosum TaxID=889282 RepID=A0A6N7PSH0_9BACT|nr:alpha/beta fold hydrolase [Polyangium spumosum]
MNGTDVGKSRVFALLGHWFTVAPVARHTLAPRRVSASVPFRWTVPDAKYGEVRLSGRLHHAPSETLLVVVHGLGGDVRSHYVLTAASAAEAAGLASLRLNLRGSDRTGEDIYHAAITQDLHAALASAELARYARVLLLGYSLGGHIVLRAATEKGLDARVRAVAAVCPPLDLSVGARAIDEPGRLVYRRHVLAAIKEIYAEVAARKPVPLPIAEARRIATIRDWDEHIVAPRFGFRGADHYYGESSVAPRLTGIEVPSLVVAAEHDPMVPADTLRPVLSGARPPLEVRWIDRGGHVGFPARVDLGFPGPGGLEDQVVAWLLGRAGG